MQCSAKTPWNLPSLNCSESNYSSGNYLLPLSMIIAFFSANKPHPYGGPYHTVLFISLAANTGVFEIQIGIVGPEPLPKSVLLYKSSPFVGSVFSNFLC